MRFEGDRRLSAERTEPYKAVTDPSRSRKTERDDPTRVDRYGIFSKVASTVTLPLALTLIVRCQALNPDFSIRIVWSPGASCKLDVVLPTNFPSIVMSLASGVDFTRTVARPDVSLVDAEDG